MSPAIFSRLADAIVHACNADGRDLDEPTFTRLTDGLGQAERLLVLAELPTWARRQIEGRQYA